MRYPCGYMCYAVSTVSMPGLTAAMLRALGEQPELVVQFYDGGMVRRSHCCPRLALLGYIRSNLEWATSTGVCMCHEYSTPPCVRAARGGDSRIPSVREFAGLSTHPGTQACGWRACGGVA